MTSQIIKEVFHLKSSATADQLDDYYTIEAHDIDKLTVDDIDDVLLYQLTENESLREPLKYLNDCFQRCQKQKRLSRGNTDLDSLFNQMDRLVIGYGLVSFQIENFALHGNLRNYMDKLVTHFDTYADFISQIIQRAIYDDSTLDFLNNFFPVLLDHLTLDIKNFDLNESAKYNNVLSIFELFVSFKPVAAIFTKIDKFLPQNELAPNEFERKTILGPILSLSPLTPNVALRNYGENLERSKVQTQVIHESLQTEHKVILNRLFFIMDKIIRGSPDSRTDVISYWAQIVNKNHLRRGDHAMLNKLASNAFMTNISLLLVRFSQPFLDISYKKIDKIDVNYFNNINLFIDLSNETRLNSDFKEADEFYDKNRKSEDSKPNFISDCFFLTLTYLHYGIGGTVLFDEKVGPQIKRIKEEIERVKKMTQANPIMNNILKLQVDRLEKTLKYTVSLKEASTGFFLHRNLQLEIFDFICGASTFLMRVIDPNHEYPFKSFSLPLIPDQVGVENVDNADYLREHAPIPFKYYPEFVVEGPINYSLFIIKYNNSPLFRNPRLHSFLEFGTTILRCPELVSNPHLKGKLAQLFSYGAMPLTDGSPGFMMSIFETNELINKNLLYALLDFYVIVEKTGASSQFYDKFNARYSISTVLEELYTRIPIYKEQLIWQAKNNPDFFIRFIARMLNDLTFLLDEGLRSLAEVHNLSLQLDGTVPQEENSELTEQDLQSRYAAAQREAKSSCGLAAKSMLLFEMYTKDIPWAFVTPEIVDRLASMLNYNLDSLVGPKCGELKVKNPEQYMFDPKALLKAVCSVYTNLAGEEEFIRATSRDTRSFRRELFLRAIDILGRRTGLASAEFCEKLRKFADSAQEMKEIEAEEDLDYGDAPNEFLDPLMYVIMNDPVTLPTSKVNIDRSTIKAHLLNDSTDPFNRMPLRLEEVIPNDELKQRIIEYKRQKRSQRMLQQGK